MSTERHQDNLIDSMLFTLISQAIETFIKNKSQVSLLKNASIVLQAGFLENY